MDLKEFLEDADMVLVGIGEVFQESFENLKAVDEDQVSIFDDYRRKEYLRSCQEDEVIQAYYKLEKLLEGKNYFIVTVCTDEKIYKTNLNSDRIVAPCGSYSFLQCEDVCTKDIYPLSDYEQMLVEGKEPFCPHCGKKLVMNHMGVKKYSEEGYLEKWEVYMKWLQGSLNRKLRIVELGVGMKYPTVIRWPFEKVTFINNKAKFVRVHAQLSQLTEDMKEKGKSISKNPVDFLRNQIV